MAPTTRRAFTAGLLAAPLAAGAGRADNPVGKPVTFYVPFAAGGAVDIVTRTLTEELAKSWGHSPIVENRPGAGGIVASQALVQAPADGATLMVVANGHPLNQFFYPRLPYDTFADFTPLAQIASSPLAISVRKDEPAADLKALLDAWRGKEGGLQFGVSGLGTSAHLAGLLLGVRGGLKVTPVAHRSGSQALQTLMSGALTSAINPLLEVLGPAEAGSLRVMAVTGAARSPLLPNVPTVMQAGLPDYDTGVWWGVVAPARLPAALGARIAGDIAAAIRSPGVSERLSKMGATPVASGPADFSRFLRAEADLWGPIIREAKLQLDR